MSKTYTPAVEILAGLKNDVLWILILIYTYVSTVKFPRINEMSRKELALEGILLESAGRDVVLRLTALDDNDSRSFQTLFSAMKREGLPSKETKKFDALVKEYRKAVNDLKVKHRNNYIAHVDEDASVTPRSFDNPPHFSTAASLAVNLLDLLNGQEVSYTFKIGSMEAKIDLRHELSQGTRT